MGFLGLLVQAMTAVLVIYSGYYYHEASREFNMAIVLCSPLLLMVGAAIKHNAKSSRSPRGFFAMIKLIVVSYIVGLIACVIFFGIGIGLYYVLVLRPEEGIGRYD